MQNRIKSMYLASFLVINDRNQLCLTGVIGIIEKISGNSRIYWLVGNSAKKQREAGSGEHKHSQMLPPMQPPPGHLHWVLHRFPQTRAITFHVKTLPLKSCCGTPTAVLFSPWVWVQPHISPNNSAAAEFHCVERVFSSDSKLFTLSPCCLGCPCTQDTLFFNVSLGVTPLHNPSAEGIPSTFTAKTLSLSCLQVSNSTSLWIPDPHCSFLSVHFSIHIQHVSRSIYHVARSFFFPFFFRALSL